VLCQPVHGEPANATAALWRGDAEIEHRTAVVEVVQVKETNQPNRSITVSNPEGRDVISGHSNPCGCFRRQARFAVERPFVGNQKFDDDVSVGGPGQRLDHERRFRTVGHGRMVAAPDPRCK
jgi:hypothetical protein